MTDLVQLIADVLRQCGEDSGTYESDAQAIIDAIGLRKEHQVYIQNQGWRPNPIANDKIVAYRSRWTTAWPARGIAGQPPEEILQEMGVYYDDDAHRYGTLSTGGTR